MLENYVIKLITLFYMNYKKKGKKKRNLNDTDEINDY